MRSLLDTHFHLDFVDDPARLIALLSDAKVAIIAQTLLPSAYQAQRDGYDDRNDTRLALGFHPWEIVDDDQVARELEVFDTQVATTSFIGEVGLDFAPRHLENKKRQVQVFTHILGRATAGHVLSIHAVRSAGAVVDLIEETATQATAVIHWFSGTSDELTRLMRAGGYISVNPRMLETKRGRAFIRQVPAERLLLETDFPATRGADATDTAAATIGALNGLYQAITQLRGEDIGEILTATQHRLFGI